MQSLNPLLFQYVISLNGQETQTIEFRVSTRKSFKHKKTTTTAIQKVLYRTSLDGI